LPVDQRAIIAANNNAHLYEAMFDAHGLRHTRLPFAFLGQDAPPPSYSNLTILAPNQQDDCRAEIAKLAQVFAGRVGLKDSFCQMELAANGFTPLFKASWLWREASASADPGNWQTVETPADLLLWEQAWKSSGSPTPQCMFPPQLLCHPDVHFLGEFFDGAFQAGCIANRSADCIGISNVFAATPSAATYPRATAAVAALDPNLPIVGYESGDDLDRALTAGFETTGTLRILVAENARF